MLDILPGGVYRIARFGRDLAGRGKDAQMIVVGACRAILGPKEMSLQP